MNGLNSLVMVDRCSNAGRVVSVGRNCIYCGGFVVDRRAEYCGKCTAKATQMASQDGLCLCCRKKPQANGKTTCDRCAVAIKKQKHRGRFTRITAECQECKSYEVMSKGGRLCRTCFAERNRLTKLIGPLWNRKAKGAANGLLRRRQLEGFETSASAFALARLLVQQDYMCALSGEQLLPDNTSVVGHKVSTANGGFMDAGNLFWITHTMNRWMATMDHTDFVALCRKVGQSSD